MLKHSIKFVKNTISKRGGALISNEYINNNNKLFIKCKYNHIFQMRFRDVVSNHWCPICISNAYSIDDVKEKVKKKKGRLISKKYKNSKTPLKIKCLVCDCIWAPSFESILKGSWCPGCSAGKSQKKLLSVLRKLYPGCKVENNYRKFDWLKNNKTGGIQEIDIFVFNKDRSFALAVEYDGEHHFYPVCWGGISPERALKKFKNTKKRDKRKNKLIREHPDDIKYFIRIKYTVDLNKEGIMRELKNKKIPIRRNNE